MSTGTVGELEIPLPPLSLQEEFAAMVVQAERLHAVQREALRQTEHLFASFLDRSFGADSLSPH
jgi:type I restriction enzyme S subunit